MEKKLKIKIAPSLLSADFSCLGAEIKKAEAAGADMLHVDVMDGHFVDNITLGPVVVKGMRKAARVPLISHLMIENPEKYVESFAQAGSDMIIFHIEAIKNAEAIIKKIHSLGKKAGVSIRPKTPIKTIENIVNLLDEVLVMTVEPGFGGQKFMTEPAEKISEIRKIYKGDIGVDGGINLETAKLVIDKGANVLIAGSFLFGSNDMKSLIEKLKVL
ncbi:MAG: ribulose-phosphate 3-epimerase [Candidatus Omnitrophica bacterium]|nr:ribulose-phosphate 3-epimerase [Candidatus Omnitrophota bacterium]